MLRPIMIVRRLPYVNKQLELQKVATALRVLTGERILEIKAKANALFMERSIDRIHDKNAHDTEELN